MTEGLERLAVGQRFVRIFTLATFEPDRHITLVDDRPRRVAACSAASRCTYAVTPDGDGRSRLVAKLLVERPTRFPGSWLAPFLPAGDLIMMRKQLLTLKHLAEGGR